MKRKKKQEMAQRPRRTWIIVVLAGEHDPSPETDGRSISKVRRVPVGRKLTSIEVSESVFCKLFATTFHFRPVAGVGRGEEGYKHGSSATVSTGWSISLQDSKLRVFSVGGRGRDRIARSGNGWLTVPSARETLKGSPSNRACTELMADGQLGPAHFGREF